MGEKSVFQGIRPKWVRDESSSICTHCSSPFTFFRRRHHCRFCGGLFCNDCCHVQAAFPVWFGYEAPQRVCEVCLPLLFNKRQEEREKTMEISIIRSNSGPDLVASGFHTSKEEILSLPLRFLHPLCKFAFWFSGMCEGGSFDRTWVNAAACMNIPLFVGDPVKSIVKRSIPVPKKWPSYDDEEWETHSIHNLRVLKDTGPTSLGIFLSSLDTSSYPTCLMPAEQNPAYSHPNRKIVAKSKTPKAPRTPPSRQKFMIHP